MAEENKEVKQPKKKSSSPLVGSQAVPTTLDDTTKIDIDISKSLIDNIIEAGIKGGLDISKLEDFTTISNSRSQVYTLIDTMAADSSVSAILKTYAEEVCETGDEGHVVWCESADPKISKYVNYLLNVMNVDKNIYAWVYCLLKYGDVYLKLYRESDYKDPIFNQNNINNAYSAKTSLKEDLDESVNLNIHKIGDQYSYYAEMVADPGTMSELTKYGKTYGYIETPNEEKNLTYLDSFSQVNGQASTAAYANYRLRSNDVNIYQADDYVHACLDDNFTRYPEKVDIFRTDKDLADNTNSTSYTIRRGKSLLIDSYKVWREKSLLENSILLNRITKSSIVRNIQVEVGDMPKSQVQNTLRRIKELFEQKSAINTGSGYAEYTNPGPVENNIFTATHNGQGAITVNAVGGDIEVKNLGDLDEWVNKFYAAYGIPKAYYGYTDDGAGFNGGTSLAIISSVFAKSVKRVQNAVIQMITDAINLFLINRGCKSYINNFVLKMKAPLTQEEKDYREDLTNRISAISNMQALFADIEDKGRKLQILKSLIQTLNYGNEILQIIDEEIDAAEQAKAEEEAQAEAEAAASEEGGAEMTETEAPAEEENAPMETVDLGNSSQAEIAAESFTESDGQPLFEQKTIYGDVDLLSEDVDLPSPEDLDSEKDFTKNE